MERWESFFLPCLVPSCLISTRHLEALEFRSVIRDTVLPSPSPTCHWAANYRGVLRCARLLWGPSPKAAVLGPHLPQRSALASAAQGVACAATSLVGLNLAASRQHTFPYLPGRCLRNSTTDRLDSEPNILENSYRKHGCLIRTAAVTVSAWLESLARDGRPAPRNHGS